MVAIEVSNHAVKRALRLCAESSPVAAPRAAAVLAVLLQNIENSMWQEVKWNFSRLTGDGYPVEFAFSSASETISYAAEFAAPEIANAKRLQIAEKLLHRLGTNSLPPQIVEQLQQIQQSGDLLYGAWLGGRHEAAGDSYKIYLEVPKNNLAAAANFARSFVGNSLPPDECRAQLRMLGYDPSAQRTELYFRTENLEICEINSIMRRFDLSSRSSDLLEFVRQIGERTFSDDFLPSNAGLSIAFSADKTPLAISLFAFARSIFRGGDDVIRRALLQHGERAGWKLQNYEKVSAPLAQRAGWQTFHGMIAFTVTRENAPTLQIGLRPPD